MYELRHGQRLGPVRPGPVTGPVLITGGAGFVGTSLAHRLLSGGESVVVLDNLSRPGVELNVKWLRGTHPAGVRVEVADVRDEAAVTRAVAEAGVVFHLPDPPPLIYTSTNKVYGGLEDSELLRRPGRYEPADSELREHGIGESRPLAFHTPYGCSKGAADQYVLDYARSFGLTAVVLRMSCVYGPHQCETEDQGWVAHFALRALDGGTITVYGDGRQVRDVLYIDDLLDAFDLPEGRGERVGMSGDRREMTAAVITAPGRVCLTRLARPEPGAGEVLIRIEGSGVCGSNAAVSEGRNWFEYPQPAGVPGHEGLGPRRGGRGGGVG